jgi:hypothetical protein
MASGEVELTEKSQNDQRITGHLGAGNGSIDISAVTGNVKLNLRDSS